MNRLLALVRAGLDYLSGRAGRLREYRANWARPRTERYRDFEAIAAYHRLTVDASAGVDDKTWHDLDMDALFSRMENSVTPIGRQYLYKRLRTTSIDVDTLDHQHRAALALLDDEGLREDVQYHLLALTRPTADSVTTLLFDRQPTPSVARPLVFTLSALSLATLALTVAQPALFPLLLTLLTLNFLITEKYSHGLYAYSQGLSNLVTLLSVGLRIGCIRQADELAPAQALRSQRATIRRLRGKFRLLAFVRAGTNSLVNTLSFYLNLLCLLDLVVFLGSIRNLTRHRDALVVVFEHVASLDAALSVASYLQSVGTYCRPQFTTDATLELQDAHHPLIDDPKVNSLRLHRESMLITGTNMAGKTTFIKTVGLNVLLGQTIGICHASAARFERHSVHASIRRQDSLAQGKSYYRAEIEEILAFLTRPDSRPRPLLLIDEIFRGTNTIERIAASATVLNALVATNTVLVTSHDVELQSLLRDYRLCHFRENPDLEQMFDYQLREGPCDTRNAIKLLGLLGYPAEIVDSADALARDLDARKLGGGE
ncbi:MAG: hypothetical protein AAGA68_23945 [Pseudomonadota bacterium]